MKFRSFCLFLTVLLLSLALTSCALLGFTDNESESTSTPSEVSKEVSSTTNVGEDLAWPKDHALAKLVPEFTAGRTTEIIESELYVRFKITDVTKKDFSDYVSKLIKAGYDDTVYTGDTLFSAVKSGSSELGVVIYLTESIVTLEVAKEIPPQVSAESLPDGSVDDTSMTDESNSDEISEDASVADASTDDSATDISVEESIAEE